MVIALATVLVTLVPSRVLVTCSGLEMDVIFLPAQVLRLATGYHMVTAAVLHNCVPAQENGRVYLVKFPASMDPFLIQALAANVIHALRESDARTHARITDNVSGMELC